MPDKIKIRVVSGQEKGKEFVFEDHDSLIFGRSPDCHICLSDDNTVSRHHFILEVNPPDARIRDMGSLHGTYVNNKKYGGRERYETPEQAKNRDYPQVDLADGDEIKIGNMKLEYSLELVEACIACGIELPKDQLEANVVGDGIYICDECRKKRSRNKKNVNLTSVICSICKKDVSAEVGANRKGVYICNDCRKAGSKEPVDPAKLFMDMLLDYLKVDGRKELPEIPNYDVVKKLGQGGMGSVYMVRHKESGKLAALKILLPQIAVNKNMHNKFIREIESTRSLRHKNVVEFLEFGSIENIYYFLLEYCSGGSLADLMAKYGGFLPLPVAKPIIIQALEGLAYLHDNNFVHRDLKPQNILLQDKGGEQVVKIADLGIAKNYEEAGLSNMTLTGNTIGTPPFMPKEQIINFKYVKPVTDVWAISATFYNMLTRFYPIDFPAGKEPTEVILSAKPVPIRDRKSDIPSHIAQIIDRALEIDTTKRYQNAGEMLVAMKKALL